MFILEVKFPGDEDWAVVGMKSLNADYATANSTYTFSPGQTEETAPDEASNSSSSARRRLESRSIFGGSTVECPSGYYDSTRGDSFYWLCGYGCPGGSFTTWYCGCACQKNPSVTLCADDCTVGGRIWANDASSDGQCDDGGAGSVFSDCALGTDCADCGSREFTSCSNACGWANDGICDDGGANAKFSGCALGSDCDDCGDREVPSSDDNSGDYWTTLCKVQESGACSSDADCRGSRLCTRSTNPSDDYLCSGDSGCKQVHLSSACPIAYPPPTRNHLPTHRP